PGTRVRAGRPRPASMPAASRPPGPCVAGPAGPVAPPLTALALTPDGKSVVLGAQAGLEVRSWPELERVRTLATELANVHDLAFSPDGTVLAIAGGSPAEKGTVELVRWPEGTLRHRVSPHRDVIYAIAWSGDSLSIVTASAD